METLFILFHYFLCVFLIAVILLQSGKGADIGASFGGASQTIFGSRGPATFLSKMTATVAVLFLATSIFLAQIAKHRSEPRSVLDKTALPEETKPIQPPAAESKETPSGEAGAGEKK